MRSFGGPVLLGGAQGDDRVAQEIGAVRRGGDLRLEAGKVPRGGRDIEARHGRGFDHRLFERRGPGENVIGRDVALILGNAKPRAGIALRVEIDDKAALAGRGQGRAEIDRGRGLTDAALLISDGQDAQIRPSIRKWFHPE